MSDKKIPGPAYMIIGAGMILMSVAVGLSTATIEKFSVFILIGAVFVVIGFFKIISKEKKSAERRHAHHAAHHAAHPQHKPAQHLSASAEQKPAEPHPQSHAAHHAAQPTHHEGPEVQHRTVVRCSSCGVKVHPLFKWCPNCGQKLK